ncbi:MAG: insulinase family protein [Verrucomicrobiales bacterium]|nr:insulinase family protein [Verrucomicrobiales bacterium]
MPPGVRVTTLSNGLEVILREDRSAPVASAQAWCRAGSVDEGRWMGAGLSHVLEHMLFKGTTTRGGGRIDQEVQAAGGYMNAFTSFDRTVYHINVPNTGVQVAVDILCDIFQNATLPAEELVKELDVIRREMDMGNDDPGRRSGRRLFETAFTRSPYRYPIIGLPDIFNRVTREDLVAYYTEKYSPSNCFLVVVGDFRAEEVLAQITSAFSQSTARAVPAVGPVLEPVQTAPREVLEEAPIELGHVHMAWHIPEPRHPDIAALDVLSTLLGSGRSSRLYQAVHERLGLAHSVSAWIYSPGLEGLFGISSVCDGDRYAAARDAILAEVERMKVDLVSPAELGKAVKQFTAGMLSTRKTMEGQALDLGSNWILANDLSFSERYLAAVGRLTPEDLRRVACKYLVESNRSTYALLPRGSAPVVEVSAAMSTDLPVRKFELENGLRLLVKEDHRLPFVEFRAALGGGILLESPENSGLTALMSRMLVKGTGTRTAEALATEIEGLGGSLDPYSGNNSFGVSAEVLRDDFAAGLSLVADVLRHPAFPENPLERERATQLAGIRGQRDQLLSSAFQAMRRGLFGERGYGLDVAGTEASVSRLIREDLVAQHQRLVLPNNAVLAVFGDVDTEAVLAAVRSEFGIWSRGESVPPLTEASGPVGPNRHEERRDKEQAVIVLGFRGTTMGSPDRHALELLQEACSDMGSRLFLRIRDELGLAYYVGASHLAGRTPGYFAFYCGTSPEQCSQVEEELRAQAERLRSEGLSAEELERAKAKVIGQRKIARQDLGQLAMASALDELYGLGFDYGDQDDERFTAVGLDDIRRVAAGYLRPETASVAVIRGHPTGT